MSSELLSKVEAWIEGDIDAADAAELRGLLERARAEDAAALTELQERFFAPLEFGTAGLRGLLGAGEHRMNRAVVVRTTLGLARALERLVPDAKRRGVVIGFDGRRKSDVFARDAAAVLVAAGFVVHAFTECEPTPVTAFAVKELGAAAGIMVTASHNPPEYNGYKVYWDNGAQIIPPIDAEIATEIAASPAAKEVPSTGGEGSISELGLEMEQRYLDGAAALSLSRAGERSLCIVHTALHGVGTKMAKQLLGRVGFSRVIPVAEQADPNGEFPTVRFPNPEEKGAMDLALRTAAEHGADLILANDPDADRLSVAVPSVRGGYVQLTGNEVGALLGHYVLTRGPRGKNLVLASLVSSPMLGVIAARLGARYEETLTGFKWIANRAMAIEAEEGVRFVFGYEEALGYTVGQLVRDKDGVSAAMLFAEMAAQLHAEKSSVLAALDALAKEYGVFVSDQMTIVRPGEKGAAELAALMQGLRDAKPTEFGDKKVLATADLEARVRTFADGREEALAMPASNVLVWTLEGDARIIARPSGTEPKAKIYFDVREPVADGESVQDARSRALTLMESLKSAVSARLGG